MKVIEGYVFMPVFKNRIARPLFGPSLGFNRPKEYSNIRGNGLEPFEEEEIMGFVSKSFYSERRDKVSEIVHYRMSLRFADNEDEFKLFRDEPKLIVVARPTDDYPSHDLYGPCIEGLTPMYAMGCCELEINGNLHFTDLADRKAYERAFNAFYDGVNRQADRAGSIGVLELDELVY